MTLKPQNVRWAQPGHKIAGIQSGQSRRNKAQKRHKEPWRDGPRSLRAQIEDFIGKELK